MYKKTVRNLLIIASSFVVSSIALAQVGSCISGMYNVYDRACDAPELKSDMCTTRIEQSPEARWCCCDAEYPLSQCGILFDAIFGKSENQSASKIMGEARIFRSDFLAKNKVGQKYIKAYYDNIDEATELLVKSPRLALETAKVISSNRGLMSNLAKGNKVKVEASRMYSVLRLLEKYVIAAGKESEIHTVATQLLFSLTNERWLASVGIFVEDSYWDVVTGQADTDTPPDTDAPPTDDDPTTCDELQQPGFCPDVDKNPDGSCPKGCNARNGTQCSCPHSGPEGSGRTDPPTTSSPGGGGGNNGGGSWGDWICSYIPCW